MIDPGKRDKRVQLVRPADKQRDPLGRCRAVDDVYARRWAQMTLLSAGGGATGPQRGATRTYEVRMLAAGVAGQIEAHHWLVYGGRRFEIVELPDPDRDDELRLVVREEASGEAA